MLLMADRSARGRSGKKGEIENPRIYLVVLTVHTLELVSMYLKLVPI